MASKQQPSDDWSLDNNTILTFVYAPAYILITVFLDV